MKKYTAIFIILLFHTVAVFSQEQRELAIGQADAIVDLRTKAGTDLMKTAWRYSDAKIVEAAFQAPGPSKSDPLLLYPTGAKIKTHDISPKAGATQFDDSKWETLDPSTLETRRGTGLLSHNWYRLNLTIPEKVGEMSTKGSTIVFEIVMDDYSEVWVNGKLNKAFGQSGNGVAPGFNARNRVFLTENAQPGETFQLAILGVNGPIADLPDNYIWVRSATLDFYKKYPSNPDWQGLGAVVAFDKKMSEIVDTENFGITKLADGFQFTEGPVWHPDGYLLFSDPNTNVIYRYDPASRNVSVYMTKSGYTGTDIGQYHQPGSNGLAIDSEGRLLVCQHGNRRVIRHEKKGPVTVLADNWQGKKLNSPNDLVLKSDGTVYFTDPPYGLPTNYSDPRKETPHQGVYRIKNGQAELLSTDLGGPNGIAFSPDEKYLYVGNWDIRDIWNTKTVWRFPVMENGMLGKGEVFFNFDQTPESEAIDGIKVDLEGNVFVSAPGGIWVLSPAGKLLGKISGPERPANMAWGDDGKTLYLTAHTGLYKMQVKTGGKTAGSGKK
ncbi:MAG: SMP-30/gluconolactonase/LRE family protein [Saprospiraceae bacterium]|nr:SMP-30/gluconolactonase/LRE family protein [Saprospiraceae bacterium]